MATPRQGPRYEAHENPPVWAMLGHGFQFSLIASATLLITPAVVARASGLGNDYLVWMVFASLLVVGVSTLIQVRRIGPVGAGGLLPMFTAAFAIPFCITAVRDGGPFTLMLLVFAASVAQLAVSRWLFVLRKIVTPIVGGTVMMILSVTLASVVLDLLDDTERSSPETGLAAAIITLIVVVAFALRRAPILRLWGPVVGVVVGCVSAAFLGIYDFRPVLDAPWVGLPSQIPDIEPSIGIPFWSLLPAFLFLGLIISILANGESIAYQRVAYRDATAVDFRQVQGTMAGAGITNVLASLVGAVPNVVHQGAVSFVQTTGVASLRVGYVIGFIFIAMAFSPKISSLLSTIPGPVMTGYLLVLVGTLLVDGARTIIQNETNRQKILVAGICFWIGAAFQFNFLTLPDLGAVVNVLLASGITSGGLAAVIMVLYIELTNPRSMRFRSELHSNSLPELLAFITKFAESRHWDEAMKDRLTAVAEETLLTLAPLNLDGDEIENEEENGDAAGGSLIVVASSEGAVANLEFIGAGNDANVEDQVRHLQQHDTFEPVEGNISLLLLSNYASSVRHQQYHNTDIITVQVTAPNQG